MKDLIILNCLLYISSVLIFVMLSRSSSTTLAKCVDLPKVVPPSSSTRTADGGRDLNAAADQRKGERDSRSEFVLHSEL